MKAVREGAVRVGAVRLWVEWGVEGGGGGREGREGERREKGVPGGSGPKKSGSGPGEVGPGGGPHIAFFPLPTLFFFFFQFPRSSVELRWSLHVFIIENLHNTHLGSLDIS